MHREELWLGMKPRRVIMIGVLTFISIITVIGLFNGLINRNDDQNWQLVQSPGGTVTARNEPGWYYAGFAHVWTWPKASDTEDFGPYRVTFSDGGTAEVGGSYRISLPTTSAEQRLLHQQFSSNEGDTQGGMTNLYKAIEAHIENCLKNTGPMMSGSEHQSARKGEFYRLVNEQVKNGMFQTRRVETILHDQTDEKGDPITVMATEVIRDDNGQPIIPEISPFKRYGIEVTQFSIGRADYDEATLRQFSAKKEAYLNAEQNKAQRQNMVEERLMIEERGKKDKAEVEAVALKEKAAAVIEAQKRVELAEAASRQAEQQKKQALVEAARDREAAVIQAEKMRDVAALNLEAEKLNAEAIKVAAAAEEERIAKAGAITEEKRVLAEIEQKTRIGVAQALSSVKVPSTYIDGGGSEGGSNGANLMNLILLRAAGIIDTPKQPTSN